MLCFVLPSRALEQPIENSRGAGAAPCDKLRRRTGAEATMNAISRRRAGTRPPRVHAERRKAGETNSISKHYQQPVESRQMMQDQKITGRSRRYSEADDRAAAARAALGVFRCVVCVWPTYLNLLFHTELV
jgi:hypothetical protein